MVHVSSAHSACSARDAFSLSLPLPFFPAHALAISENIFYALFMHRERSLI